VIPRRKKDGLKGFFWPRYKYSGEEEMVRVQQAIIAALG
jgi:histidine triad (HIT) family protein